MVAMKHLGKSGQGEAYTELWDRVGEGKSGSWTSGESLESRVALVGNRLWG